MNKKVEQSQTYFRQKYQHYDDLRTQEQIQLSNLLVRALSENNLRRVASINNNSSTSIRLAKSQFIRKNKRKEDFLYVCFNGVPAFENQFTDLKLPGQMLNIQAEGFQLDLTDDQRKQKVQHAQLQDQAKMIQSEINNRSKTKQIVFVYHSFGAFLLSVYLHFYGSQRVVGMIDIGGAPITCYEIIKEYFKITQKLEIKKVKQNLECAFEGHSKWLQRRKMIPFKNKEMTVCFLTAISQGFAFQMMFELIRRWPNVLKCMIYGRKDTIFQEKLLNQKAIYYGYKKEFNKVYERNLINKYKIRYGVEVENIQERFLFNIESGFHSLHMQKKLKRTLEAIVGEYLEFLEEDQVEAKI